MANAFILQVYHETIELSSVSCPTAMRPVCRGIGKPYHKHRSGDDARNETHSELRHGDTRKVKDGGAAPYKNLLGGPAKGMGWGAGRVKQYLSLVSF